MVLNTRVLKEPRGFVRIIQCILAIVAFATTAGFSSSCSFEYECNNGDEHDVAVSYAFGYPFHIKNNKLTVSSDCEHDTPDHNTPDPDKLQIVTLPFDYSAAAEFFVAVGVLSFLYSIIALIIYVFLHQQYSSDTKVPVIDLGISSVITVFWLAGSSAWAQGVQDVKYFLHPESMFGFIKACNNEMCKVLEEGSYAALNVSLVLGFACFALWFASLWFIYKETVFHTPTETVSDVSQNQNAKGDGRV